MIISGYQQLLDYIMEIGDPVAVRGRPTVEVIGMPIYVDMSHPIIANPDRKVWHQFMVDEARWILEQRHDIAFSQAIAKCWEPYAEGGYVRGAYGLAFGRQIVHITELLQSDRSTRQAVMQIWAEGDYVRKSKSTPCTVSLQWLVRDGRIDCIANMRSSDAWTGFPYDIFCFGMMTFYVALGLDPIPRMGGLHMLIGSAHLYAENIQQARCVIAGAEYPRRAFPYETIKSRGELIERLKDKAIVCA